MSIPISFLKVIVNMVTLTTPDIPEELLRLSDAPKQLFASDKTLPKLMKMPRLAVVGSRKVSPYGRSVTTKLTSDLARKGVVIVSGLALGVDSLAHSSCLDAGGVTIAVLPTGLDRIYPTSHTQLARQITEKGGILVSEYPERTDPMRHNFIARNRIIAALAEGLLITEAAIASGSLHTARFALELGIPVFAVPGPINSPTSEGTNNLIKTGAILVQTVDDILHEMPWTFDQGAPDAIAYTPEEMVILELIKQGISDGNELLVRSELAAPLFYQTLTMLELTGRVRPLGANQWTSA